MKTVIKAIIFIIMALTVVFYGGAYMLPGASHVERSIDIAAPPEKVFAIAGNLRRVPEWSPWPAIDPKVSFSFEGPEQGGVGQVMRWSSNNPMVGNGTETVTDYAPDVRLLTKTDYGGFGSSAGSLTLTPLPNGTRVTRSIETPLPGVIDRWAGLGMDRTVGTEVEKGLGNLKARAEAP